MTPFQAEPPLAVPIRNFQLVSPDFEGGIFRIKHDNRRYNAWFSIQELFRLFDVEGINPLEVNQPLQGYRFTRAAIAHYGSKSCFTGDDGKYMTVYGFEVVEP